ncbi:hypothetical protein PRZ48_014500 [Zasmidium cellare]|uniref:Uncharacterized protein n=1 Tax=Zasmidium cellare TaxID=395010 RepID=A0ABR0DYF7_ZASCE|nr:hypothetical protein PRZ48_014500 [Zasmidium cellare]
MASAVPPTQFQLDRSLFNENLYSGIRSFWFVGLPAGSKEDNPVLQKRWWGLGRSEEESKAFDEEVRQKYGNVLESIGPEKIALPAWKSYEWDAEHKTELAAPFLREVQTAQDQDTTGAKAAQTLLSLILLLDQFPRQIYRTQSSLPLVYRHYDRLSYALLTSSHPTLTLHSLHRGSPVHRMWFALPAMHAEDLGAQNLSLSILRTSLKEAEEDGDTVCAEQLKRPVGFAEKHKDIVERFGRFPHRNECLEREHAGEEEEWLRTGETFGVKQSQKEDAKKPRFEDFRHRKKYLEMSQYLDSNVSARTMHSETSIYANWRTTGSNSEYLFHTPNACILPHDALKLITNQHEPSSLPESLARMDTPIILKPLIVLFMKTFFILGPLVVIIMIVALVLDMRRTSRDDKKKLEELRKAAENMKQSTKESERKREREEMRAEVLRELQGEMGMQSEPQREFAFVMVGCVRG